MSFKFFVGQTVEYTPIGERTADLYKIVRQMPEEEQAFDLRYLIQSESEAYARNVPECGLSSDVGPESEYATTKLRLSRGSHTINVETCSFEATAARRYSVSRSAQRLDE